MATSKPSRNPAERREFWVRLIQQQEQSALPVSVFCQQNQIPEQSFYTWRKRLREESTPVRFSLVEVPGHQATAPASPLELVLANGHRLRISAGAEEATRRTVLEVLLPR
jgi:transposase-like protein